METITKHSQTKTEQNINSSISLRESQIKQCKLMQIKMQRDQKIKRVDMPMSTSLTE